MPCLQKAVLYMYAITWLVVEVLVVHGSKRCCCDALQRWMFFVSPV